MDVRGPPLSGNSEAVLQIRIHLPALTERFALRCNRRPPPLHRAHLLLGAVLSAWHPARVQQPSALSTDPVVVATRLWLEKAVIGLDLCPFAKAVHIRGQIRYVVSEARTDDALLDDLRAELHALHVADPTLVDTTLLVHPHVLQDFADYNAFLDLADDALADAGLIGEIQVASFHPRYQFAGTGPDDIGNFTNRSPYPTLHLLREASISRAVRSGPDSASIYEANIATMEKLGHEGWAKLGLTPSS